jgi:hypothetical protein
MTKRDEFKPKRDITRLVFRSMHFPKVNTKDFVIEIFCGLDFEKRKGILNRFMDSLHSDAAEDVDFNKRQTRQTRGTTVTSKKMSNISEVNSSRGEL